MSERDFRAPGEDSKGTHATLPARFACEALLLIELTLVSLLLDPSDMLGKLKLASSVRGVMHALPSVETERVIPAPPAEVGDDVDAADDKPRPAIMPGMDREVRERCRAVLPPNPVADMPDAPDARLKRLLPPRLPFRLPLDEVEVEWADRPEKDDEDATVEAVLRRFEGRVGSWSEEDDEEGGTAVGEYPPHADSCCCADCGDIWTAALRLATLLDPMDARVVAAADPLARACCPAVRLIKRAVDTWGKDAVRKRAGAASACGGGMPAGFPGRRVDRNDPDSAATL